MMRSRRNACPSMSFEFAEVLLGPAAEDLQWLEQGAAKRGERVLHFRNGRGINFAFYQSIALQTP